MKTQDTFIAGRLIPAQAVEMADQAYWSGQPFMDSLVAALLARGANTPEQNDDWLRRGLLQESVQSSMLTSDERDFIWHRYHVPRWKRWWYRTRTKLYERRVKEMTG